MDLRILKELNYECYRDRIVRVICPLFKKTIIFDFVYTIICIYRPVSTKLGQNIYVQRNLNELILIMAPIGPEQLELFTLELRKIATFDFVYSLTSVNVNQTAPNLVTMNMISDEFDYGSSHTKSVGVLCP